MEPINETLKRVIKSPDFSTRYESIRNEIIEDPGIQKFISENDQEITKSVVDRGLGKLYEYTSQHQDCDDCPSVRECENMMKGFIPKLILTRGTIDLDYVQCQQKLVEDKRNLVSKMISSMHMPKDVLKARLEDVDFDEDGRIIAGVAANKFISAIRETGEVPAKGLYLFGKFGVGKSYLLGAIANELASMHIQTVLVYVPEFLKEMKNSIQDHSVHEKVDYVKKAPVLMLDDIGAETMSPWTRDEILGTIFHYRMAENLPTFITSNLDFKELEGHLATTSKGDQDLVKAGRIMERIVSTTIPVKLTGKNRRINQ